MAKNIGVLTAGGDSPGINAALRGLGKAALDSYGMTCVGFYDGFRGLMQNRTINLESSNFSGILTSGGTILGTSGDTPNAMPVGGRILDMTEEMLDNYQKHRLDVLVCIGGGETQKSAQLLAAKGLNIITLPKTIDNDISMTDVCFGFDTALGIATEAIDRLHSTAHSHHRIIVVETMGHYTGWLALGAGISGGADVILIPEIPYDTQKIAEAILRRARSGKPFSIVAVSEGAMSMEDDIDMRKAQNDLNQAKKQKDRDALTAHIAELETHQATKTLRLATRLEELTCLESRVTILGHVQRGGTPSAGDRLLATRLGTAAAKLVKDQKYGVMDAVHGELIEPVALDEVIRERRVVPLDHSWIESARRVGTCMGD